MSNRFGKTLCSLITLGLVFVSSSWSGYEDNFRPAAKPTIMKAAVSKPALMGNERLLNLAPIETKSLELSKPSSNYSAIKLPEGFDMSNLYLVRSNDERNLLGYGGLSSPKINYLFNGGEQKMTKEQARERLRRQFFEYLGVEGTILSGDVFKGTYTHLRIKPDFNPLSGDQNFLIIWSFEY